MKILMSPPELKIHCLDRDIKLIKEGKFYIVEDFLHESYSVVGIQESEQYVQINKDFYFKTVKEV